MSRAYYASLAEAYARSQPPSGAPKLLNAEMIATPPDFPRELLGTKIKFTLRIDKTGRVVSVASPDEILLKEAIVRQIVQALFTWRALPAIKEGRAIDAQLSVPVEFKL